jgi:hypothetical protein
VQEPRLAGVTPAGAPPAFDTAWGGPDAGQTRPLPPANGRPRALPDGRAAATAEELAGMAASIGEVDPRSAERLDDLARAVVDDEGRRRWAEVDLRRAFQTDRLAHAYAVRREGGYASGAINVADKVRNVLVLVPIFLTWFALAEASRAYARFISANPDEVRQPFLLLWERRFGGEASPLAPTFSFVALVDAFLLLLIIVLTLYAHGRREDRDEAIATTAGRFQADLDNALAAATVVLAQEKGGRPAALTKGVERLADRFDRSSQELLNRLRVEHDRLEQLASRREREFADFGVFASGMRAGAEETHRLLVELRTVSAGLQGALEDLTTEVGVSADQGRTLLSAVQGLEQLTAASIQSDQAVANRLASAAETIADAAEKAVAGADAAAQAGRLATDTGRALGELAQTLSKGQARTEAAIASEAEATGRLAEALRSSSGGVAAAARSLGEIEASLAGVRDGFAALATQNAEGAKTLRAILAEQEAIASGLSEVAHDLGSVAVGSAQRQDASGRDVAALVGRLDALADLLARTQGLPPPLPGGDGGDGGRGGDPAGRDPSRLWPQRRTP